MASSSSCRSGASDTSSEASFMSTDNAFSNNVLNQGVLLDITSVFDGIKLSLYKFDISTICNELDIWAYNRRLNENHVNEIYKNLCEQKFPHLMGTIKVVKDNNDNIQVIDGFHRSECLKRYNANNPGKSLTVFLEIYHVESIQSPVVFDLFKIANANLNLTAEDDVNLYLAKVVDDLISDPDLSQGIVNRNDGRVNRPRISKKDLYESLKAHIKIQDMGLPIESFVKRVKAINQLIGKKSVSELYGRTNPCPSRINMRNTAVKYNFYLNLPGKYSIEKWIDMISNSDA